MDIITILYYVMTAFFGVILILNFMRARNAQEAILYLVILMPFVMRVLRVK